MAAPAELLTGEVTDLNADAKGVTRHDGKVVFVRDCLPGETIQYQLRKRRRKHNDGLLTEVITPAANRVEPRCEAFGNCGGCSLQHMSEDAQRDYKQALLISNLDQIGGVAAEELAPALAGSAWGYRRRGRLGVKHVDKKGRTLVGFRERDKPYIADMDACHVLIPEVGQQLQRIADCIDGMEIRHRLPQIEVAGGDNGIAMVLRILDPLTQSDKQKLETLADETGWWLYLQPEGMDSIRPLRDNTPSLQYGLPDYDVTLTFEPTDFIQINGELNKLMVKQAMDWLAPQAGDSCLELFAGLGNFSLPLARLGTALTTVEGEASLVTRADQNAKDNDITTINTHVDDLYRQNADLTQSAWAKQQYKLALIDPPRSGAREALPAIAGCGVERLLYVSCHPGTLARDAGILINEHGYKLKKAGVLDMFPHTKHAEAMALFER